MGTHLFESPCTTPCQKVYVLLWTKVPLFLCTVDVGYFRHNNLFLMWSCPKSNWHPVMNEIISTLEVSTKTWWHNTNFKVANVGFVFNLTMQCLFSACCCLSHLITIYYQEAFNIIYQQHRPLTCDNIHEQCCTKNSFSRLSMQTKLRPHLVCGWSFRNVPYTICNPSYAKRCQIVNLHTIKNMNILKYC